MRERPRDEVGLRRRLVAADGYLDLGMAREALGELAALDGEERDHPHVFRLRVRAHLRLREWAKGLELAASAARRFPGEGEFFVQWAYALRKAQPWANAREVLDGAPEPLRRSGMLHYNLARFEARDGDLDEARICLKEACRLNPAVLFDARRDPLLQPLWN